MPLVDMKDMLAHAHGNGYAVGAFDLVGLEFLEGILAAAERCRSPVILSLAADRSDFEAAIAAAERGASRAEVPAAIHLDHGRSLESAVQAINRGCNGVMVDTSREPFPANVARTRAVVEMAHGCGAFVEGALGCVAGVEGEDTEQRPGEVVYTSVGEARAYVARTQVDCLAVSVGNVPGRVRGRPRLDFERLKRIRQAVDIPLAIRGAAGLSDEQVRRLISHGVAKIDCHTALSGAATAAARANVRADGAGGYAALLDGVREAIGAEVERCQRVFGAAGRAAEVLAQCRPWEPIAHVILYNVESSSDADVKTMMARGREALSKIPGVRRVVTGWALSERPEYRFCWLVELAHEKVSASYRDHPDYATFANGFFRPMVGERITLDFAEREEGAEAGSSLPHRRRYG
jgi:fructose-bisphosphate aldolase, class II